MKKLISLFALCILILSGACAALKNYRDDYRRVLYPEMLADIDPIPAGTIEAEFDNFFGTKISKKRVETFFDPRTNRLYLQFRYQSVLYRQFWDPPGREAFKKALNSYKVDYAGRNLTLKASKALKAYGTIKSFTEWGTLATDLNEKSQAYPLVNLGYAFKDSSPYFTITQNSADDIVFVADNVHFESLYIQMFYTRAQADALAALFDEDYLLGLLDNHGGIENPNPEIEDDYKETF
jgi:hypothetical protein